MALEDVIAENTKAMNNLTAALNKGGSGSTTAATPSAGTGRPPGRPKAIPFDDVKAIAEKVRDTESLGRAAAVELIKRHGADSLANLDKSKYAAFIAAAQVMLSEAETPGEEEGAEADAEL